MAVFVLPCGLSILDAIRTGHDGGDGGDGGAAPKGFGPPRRGAALELRLRVWAGRRRLREDPSQLTYWLADDATRVLTIPVSRGGVELAAWGPRKHLSAELGSLHAGNVVPVFRDADRVVLLASDTDEGILAALLNTTLLERGADYWPEPPDLRGGDWAPAVTGLCSPGVGVPVSIVRIPGLVPKHSDEFAAAAGRVAMALIWAAQQPQAAGGVVFHLAGGYKATIPFLVPLAEYVHAYLAPTPLTVWCKHLSGDEAIAVPLRLVDLADLDVLPSVPAGGAVDDARLEGFAHAGRKLTEVGKALEFFRAHVLSGPVGTA
jgi:hypothetical protein